MIWLKNVLKLLLAVVIVSSASLYQKTVTAVAPIITLDLYRHKEITNEDMPKILELVAKQENIDYKQLKELALCESTLRHYKDEKNKKVLTGVKNPKDTGVFQINEIIWKKQAEELNLDINDPIDNCLLAVWIIKNDSRSWKNWVCYSK